MCEDYNEGVINYTASITSPDGETTSSIDVDSEDCRASVCSAKFLLSTKILSTFEFRVILSANNLAGSTSVQYHDPICKLHHADVHMSI